MAAVVGQNLALDVLCPRPCSGKKRRVSQVEQDPGVSLLESLPEEIVFLLLDRLEDDPLDLKSFSLLSRSLYAIESRHRRQLRPLRSDLLPATIARYMTVECLDFTLCPRVGDSALAAVSGSAARATLKSVNLSRSRYFSHAGLEALARSCSVLTDLDLSNAIELTDAAAAAISNARGLKRLCLSRCKAVTDMGIGCIAVGCPNLTVLSLKWCLGITDLGVGLVAVKCKEIQSLDLSYTMITKKSFSAVMELPVLKDLFLVGCLDIGDEALTSLIHGNMSLQTLDLWNCQHINKVGISSVLELNPALHHLNLAYSCPATCAIGNSCRTDRLRTIRLDGCRITSSALRSIVDSGASLLELSLSKCSGVTDEGLAILLLKQKDLRKLDLTCSRNITDASLDVITRSCSSLIALRMESCTQVSRKGFHFIGKQCHFLEDLDLTDNDLDDEGLQSIARCSKLTSLKIGICLNITDEGLVQIAKSCPQLLELDLYRSSQVSDTGVTEIAKGCRKLQMINLAYCTKITDESLQSLARCSELNTLEMRGCTKITSAGISAVAAGCRKLSKLDIKKCCQINDACMLQLAHCSQNLRQINLSYCSISDVGLVALASIRCLQNLVMLHLAGITPNGLASALLISRGLTKVKLHLSFKSMLQNCLLGHIEARGCFFLWSDKPFQQVEVEPNAVWKQQSMDVVLR